MNFKVYEFYLEFMNQGFSYIKKTNLDVSINEKEFSDILSIINFVREQFVAIAGAMQISFMYFY